MSLRKAAEDDPSVWAPSIYMGDSDDAIGSWLQSVPVLAIVAIHLRSEPVDGRLINLPSPTLSLLNKSAEGSLSSWD